MIEGDIKEKESKHSDQATDPEETKMEDGKDEIDKVENEGDLLESKEDKVENKGDKVENEEDQVESAEDKARKAREEAIAKEDEVKPVFYIVMFVLGMSLLGVLDLTVFLPDNKCQMTYMYEWPEYINISMQEDNGVYKLYAYSEGVLAESIKAEVNIF